MRVSGRFVEAQSVTAAATASIQPASGETLQMLPEAQRTSNMLEFWGLSEARPMKRADGKSPSIVHWKGEHYKVMAYEDWWQHGRYWFALCSKVDQ